MSQRRIAAVSAAVVACVWLLSACGSSSSDGVAAKGQPADAPDAVVRDFGRAMYTGDTATMTELLLPAATDQMTDAQRELLDGLSAGASDVELRHFGYQVVDRGEGEISVRYSGERCAPVPHQQFTETTVVAGPGDSGSSSSEGVSVDGDVVCVDIGEKAASRPPIQFTLVDGHWYARPPRLA